MSEKVSGGHDQRNVVLKCPISWVFSGENYHKAIRVAKAELGRIERNSPTGEGARSSSSDDPTDDYWKATYDGPITYDKFKKALDTIHDRTKFNRRPWGL